MYRKTNGINDIPSLLSLFRFIQHPQNPLLYYPITPPSRIPSSVFISSSKYFARLYYIYKKIILRQ